MAILRIGAGLAAACVAACAGHAQVVINELYENPPESGAAGDDRWEYIELYGTPGMSLSGFAIALIKGGADPDGDDIPGPRPMGWDTLDELPEFDEVWSLNGQSLGSNGFFVLYNNTGAASFIPGLLPDATNRAGFSTLHIPSSDSAGRLGNDASSTYVLLRLRPTDNGVPPFTTSWRKDVRQDVNYDSQLDWGNETPLTMPIIFPAPRVLEPYQMVDDIAWSNEGGKEYTRSSQQEISDTPGFNPDAVSRLAYYPSNPQSGNRFNGGVIEFTRMADEEFIYGDMIDFLGSIEYNPVDTKGPTDPAGPTYDGSCDPDTNPGCMPAPGPYRFEDIDVTGFMLTPGAFNDGGVSGITQFRFVRGDCNFDGAATMCDYALLRGALWNKTGSETEPCLDALGNPAVCYSFQGRLFNSLWAALHMNPNDGMGGANSPMATLDDATALLAEVCVADNNCDGIVNSDDFISFLLAFSAADQGKGDIASSSPAACPAADGVVNTDDFICFLIQFSNGCP